MIKGYILVFWYKRIFKFSARSSFFYLEPIYWTTCLLDKALTWDKCPLLQKSDLWSPNLGGGDFSSAVELYCWSNQPITKTDRVMLKQLDEERKKEGRMLRKKNFLFMRWKKGHNNYHCLSRHLYVALCSNDSL